MHYRIASTSIKALKHLLKWLAIVFTALFGLALLLSLLLLLFLDDDDYKSASIAFIERTTQSKLTIAGDYRLSLSLHPSLTMSDVRLIANSGGYSVQAGQVALRLHLARLWSGLIWFEDLKLDDISIAANALPEETGGGIWTPGSLIPVFERAHITNFRVENKHHIKQRATVFSVTRLSIDQRGRDDNLRISGTGTWRGNAIDLSGALGPTKDLLNSAADYPIKVKFNTPATTLTANGTLRDVAREGEVNLNIAFHTQELSTWLEIWSKKVPADLAMTATARLTGFAKELRLTELKAELMRPDVMSMQLSGELGIGRFPRHTGLTFSARLADPSTLEHVLPPILQAFSGVRLTGELRDEKGQLELKDVLFTAQSKEGLDMTLAGSAALALGSTEMGVRELSATLDFSAPMSTALQPLLPVDLPRLGPVSGHLRLASNGDALSIEDIDLQAGEVDATLARVTGRLERLSVTPDEEPSGFDLNITIQSKNTAGVSGPLGWRLPENGPIWANARLVGDSATLSVEKIAIRSGTAATTQLNIHGKTDLGPPGQRARLRDGKFDVTLSASSTANIGALLDKELPDIGPFKGQLYVSGEDEKFSVRIPDLSAGREAGVSFQGDGVIEQVRLHPRFRIDGMRLTLVARAATTRALEAHTASPLPEFGPINGAARVVQEKTRFALRNIVLSAGRKDAPLWSAKGQIRDLVQLKGIDLKVNADTQTAAMLNALTGDKHPDLGQLKGQLRLSGAASELSISSLAFKSGLDDIYQATLSGSVDGVGELNRFDLTDTFNILDPARFNDLFDVNVPLLKPVETHGRLTGRLGAERLSTTIRTGSSEARLELTKIPGKARSGIKGKISIPVLHLADLPIIGEDKSRQTAQATPGAVKTKRIKPIFSQTPFDLGGLQQIDAELDIRIDEVVGARANIDRVSGHISLQDGRLRISPLSYLHAGGNAHLELELDARASPQGRLWLFTDAVPLSSLFESTEAKTTISGDLSLDVDLESRGHSPHEMASNLQGHFRMMAENSRIPRYNFDLVTEDILGWAISKTTSSRNEARLDCSIANISVDKGIAQSNTLIIDARNYTITGNLSLDLGRETIDLAILPQRKNKIWKRLDPVRVTGALSDPKVTVISKTEVIKTYGTLLLLPQVYIGQKALGLFSGLASSNSGDVDSPCQKLELQLLPTAR